MTNISKEYGQWLAEIKKQIRRSQIKAAVKVNTELLKLYWNLGKEISEKQMDTAWGSRFFDALSRDLKAEFSDMQGFSPTNLKYCKRFYLFYIQSDIIRHQVGDELTLPIFSIPWRHHIEIMTKCHSVDEALFYVDKTLENGWSRAVLMNFLDTQLYAAQGKAITNFSKYLPEPMSDLAQQTLKDPYNFDFLTMRENYNYILSIRLYKVLFDAFDSVCGLSCNQKERVLFEVYIFGQFVVGKYKIRQFRLAANHDQLIGGRFSPVPKRIQRIIGAGQSSSLSLCIIIWGISLCLIHLHGRTTRRGKQSHCDKTNDLFHSFGFSV